MKKILSIFTIALLFSGAYGASVVGSKHDLSVGGGSSFKAVNEKNSCVFCHTPHHSNGEQPLWNHQISSVSNYVVYSSARLTNLNVNVPQPNGSSRLCLSCHDGTVALGNITSGAAEIEMQGGVTTLPSGNPSNLGTDLSEDHPISFAYDSDLATRDPDVNDPASLSTSAVKMDPLNRLQCTSCHNPHDDQYGNFLVMDNTGSALCLVCHKENTWGTSAHAVSATPTPSVIVAKLATSSGSLAKAKITPMAANACGNCHTTHRAQSKSHLLLSRLPEENCFDCHNGVTSRKNLLADFQKPSVHPITLNRDAHSPTEDPINPKSRHVACADCHNPHAANNTPATAPYASGALAGVAGATSAGGIITPLLKEYELCFRCHGDSLVRGPATVPRQYTETDTRVQFSAGNQSYHPVVAQGKNISIVPSLLSPWTTGSLMYCTDCHNSDSSSKAGGTGANGPHGSIYAPILERNLVMTDHQMESFTAYALCYKCHSRDSILANRSFPFHRKHIVDDQTACTTCHDSHGVVNAQHLINFNTTYVKPSSNGLLEYNSTGYLHGNCSLTCHGKDHQQTPY